MLAKLPNLEPNLTYQSTLISVVKRATSLPTVAAVSREPDMTITLCTFVLRIQVLKDVFLVPVRHLKGVRHWAVGNDDTKWVYSCGTGKRSPPQIVGRARLTNCEVQMSVGRQPP